MAEYIERETIKSTMIHYGFKSHDMTVTEFVEDELPAADVAPVRHGRWVSVPHKLARICSVCNHDEPYKLADIDADVYDYCPNCGAKMDGGAD